MANKKRKVSGNKKSYRARKDPFAGKFTRLSAIPGSTVIPNRKGNDLYTKDDSYDAHIRLEDLGNGQEEIVVDIFDSKIKNASKAYIRSENFSNDSEGLMEAQEFLKHYRFDYKLMPAT